jgi:copper/silver efflux system protein
VALSFLPVLALEAQEGRLFIPLAYTKTYAMVAAALLSITVVPVLIALLIRGGVRAERENPLNRAIGAAYRPMLSLAMRHPWGVVVGALVLVLISAWPASRLGTEFMPDMDEGDLLYMPVTMPGISADAARALLQRTDALIRQVPEVERVFGKAGRADTATDPAPLEMLETVIKLKPRDAWRAGLTLEELKAELDARVRLPGVTNAWLPPIKARIEMLATGVRTPLGIKIQGPDLARIEALGTQIEKIVKSVPGAASVYAERVSAGRYIDVDVNRVAAARYGLNIDDVHDIIAVAAGGDVVGQVVEGRERYPISVRYPQDWRNSLERLRTLPIVTELGPQITLGDVATIRVVEGPSMIRSEDAQPSGWVYATIEGRSLGAFVDEVRERVMAERILPAGYSLRWSGQYESLERAFGRLKVVVPFTLAIIVLMLWLNFRRVTDVLLVLGSLPVALVGSMWFLWLLGYHVSVAVAVGLIALAGVAAETGIVMLIYLNNAWAQRRRTRERPTEEDLHEAIVEGALLRLRPKIMTVLAIIAGLLPILIGTGTGSEVTRRIAAPMVGGMVSATLLTLLVIPALYLLVERRALEGAAPVDTRGSVA